MQLPIRLSRMAGLEALAAALPRRLAYSSRRNFALPIPTTTLLSPFIRRRILEEEEVLRALLSGVRWEEVEKLVQEVVWRTYWKGWMEQHPDVWHRYLASVRDPDSLGSGTKEEIQSLKHGFSRIPCMNDWAAELQSIGYLHNHQRMWFASIWIFTLKLPWELGAKFFLEHLLDGDPASNTLSWRWVAGLQTKGKRYLATPENISRFTEERWTPEKGSLADEADAVTETPSFSSSPDSNGGYLVSTVTSISSSSNQALLIHPEDLHPESLPLNKNCIRAVVVYRSTIMESHTPSHLVVQSVSSALDDATARIRLHFPTAPCLESNDSREISLFLKENRIEIVVTPRVFLGFLTPQLKILSLLLRHEGIPVQQLERSYDERYLRYATRGFFPFWEVVRGKVREEFSK
jgi:deoxyribodipyrimidine photo-lyase